MLQVHLGRMADVDQISQWTMGVQEYVIPMDIHLVAPNMAIAGIVRNIVF